MDKQIADEPVRQQLLCEDGYPIAATLYRARVPVNGH